MPTYITKIDLLDAADNDYRLLWQALEDRAFIQQSAAITDRLQYSFKTISGAFTAIKKSLKIQDVIDDVVDAAAKTGKKFSFTVIKDKP